MNTPFFVVEDFISPLQCDKLLALNHEVVQTVPSIRLLNDGGSRIIHRSINEYSDDIDAHYNCTISNDIKVSFIHLPENPSIPGQPQFIDGWHKTQKRKWERTKNIDLIGIVPLKTYCDTVPIDTAFEVYGGKIEMTSFNFSFIPERGSLIMFPCAPNFIHAVSPINFGTMQYVKIYLSMQYDWEFNIENFSVNLNDLK